MTIDPNASAFPTYKIDREGALVPNTPGLSIRQLVTALALVGLLASGLYAGDTERLAGLACALTDALLTEWGKPAADPPYVPGDLEAK